MPGTQKQYYKPEAILDAPEYHEYARAMGSLTWGTWDHGVRPFAERAREFVSAYPPEDPARFAGSGEMTWGPDAAYTQGTPRTRLERLLATDGRAGSLSELLARYGLAIESLAKPRLTVADPSNAKDAARRRNVRLRVLHGGVDLEPADMEGAKVAYLETQEKKDAAEQVRAALRRMRQDLDKPGSAD